MWMARPFTHARRSCRTGAACGRAAAIAMVLLVAASVPVRAAPVHVSEAPAPTSGFLDATPRMAVVSAFGPELALLSSKLEQPRKHTVDGVTFTTGTLHGEPVVLFLSGVSMVNAAMNVQRALDRFHITHIMFSGIAGGVNPALHIGDVAVASSWAQYLGSVMARKTASGVFQPPPWMTDIVGPHYGMIFPRKIKVRSPDRPAIHKVFWFPADARMLAVAQNIESVKLSACDGAGKCLARTPRLVVGGHGVSGPVFMDNAKMRAFLFNAFHANVVDMESAAVAQVAYSNGVPFIVFRSLSDLAGGDAGKNQMQAFMNVAANNSAKVLLAFLDAWKRGAG
jgi:adenosylhomocysteine nucleosidase